MKLTKRKEGRSIIPVSSMADIAFLLLIFFMLSSIAEVDKEIPLKLPESRMSVQEKKKYFNVWIPKEGEYFFGGKKGTLTSLTTHAQYMLISNPEVRALIRAERNILYENVNAALDALNKGGVHNVVLVSKRKNLKNRE